MKTYDPKARELCIKTIKGLAMDAVEKANSGHPGTPMGLADIAFEMFASSMRHDPSAPQWTARDRFVLSAGHASMLLYSMLHLSGYDLSLDDLKNFRQWGSKTPGHPEHGMTPGVETTTGPLGQGVGNAIGLALGMKMREQRYGDIFKARVFCICSDGDMMEGVSGEASSIAGHLGIDNLTVVYDDNKITIEGETSLAFSEDVGMRYEAYGWFVQRIDGHDPEAIRGALEKAAATKGKPSFIVARTHIANGAPNAHDTAEAHGAPLGKEEIALTKKNMGFDPEKTFFVPEEVRALFKARAAELAAERTAWDKQFAEWKTKNAELAAKFESAHAGTLPANLYEELLKAVPAKEDATRNLSNAIQQKVAELVPQLVGGSADLAPSTKTLIKGAGSINKHEFAGRNFHFGIREHGMGAVLNGLSLVGGFIPYGATFLVFSDYMRPSVRLSSLMEQRVLWIYTHDSIFLGEDGPTHQPIEHVSALRLIPHLHVMRPADGMECAAMWTMAVERTKGPTAFALSRQKLPTLPRPAGFDTKTMLKGGYVVRDAEGGAPEAVILATGSEVGLAIGAQDALAKEGKRVRVVSMLCLEQFHEQDAAYQDSVLPKNLRRVSVEAGTTLLWKGVVGEKGLAIGIDHFGASAPDKVLGEKFGFTVPAVTEKIRAWW